MTAACGDSGEGGTGGNGGNGGDYPLDGASCDYLCGGPACNSRCEDDVLYYCGSDNELTFREDCAKEGLSCVFVEDPSDPAAGEKLCQ